MQWETLAQAGVAVLSGPVGKPGSYRGVRLLPGEVLSRAVPALRRQLAEAVLAEPPHALRWMRGHSQQVELLSCISDPSVDAHALMSGMPAGQLNQAERADVLALRGLLACGVLDHCLQMRHLVDFGVNDGPTARKRLAVPYRAAHVPSDRSEYAQPDSALALTSLAYYHRGLSKAQLLEALKELLRLGQNAQQAYYGEWLALAAADVSKEELGAVDQASKLDTTNAAQVDLLHRLYSHNMAAVDFWLNFCVFPTETRQYPHRLVATSWDLADSPNGRVVGFSGTNDNHRLLPLSVRQHLEVEERLRATNGKMLAVLLENEQYHTLVPREGMALWEALLRFAVERRLDALVDCGALLAGTSNRAAAAFLLPLLDRARFRGVCHYDEEEREWVVVDLLGRRLPRHQSPIRESQAFTLFDEARCRGADLQLRPAAVGLLTLGPSTCKDKLMQSAGRLRKLGKGQTLQIVGTADVTAKISRLAGTEEAPAGAGQPPALTSCHVLAWAMSNTVAATQRGVLEWGHQGLLFADTLGAPERSLQPEVLELAAMYGAARDWRGVPELVSEQHSRRQAARDAAAGSGGSHLAPAMQQLTEAIVAAGRQYGMGHQVVAQSGLGEECERELEREEEEEEEVERQVPRVEPAAEEDWHYGVALSAASLSQLERLTGVHMLPLAQLAARVQPEAVGRLAWSPLAFCTPNFAATVQQQPGEAVNEYLRPVSHLLLLPGAPAGTSGGNSGSSGADMTAGSCAVVMLTEREANGLLEVMWSGSSGSTVGISSLSALLFRGKGGPLPLLVSLCYACEAQEQVPAPRRQPVLRLAAAVVGGGAWRDLGPLVTELCTGSMGLQLVSLQLWDGETTYAREDAGQPLQWRAARQLPQLGLLRQLVAGRGTEAEALVAMRGKQVLLLRSQLELACDAADRRGEAGGEGAAI